MTGAGEAPVRAIPGFWRYAQDDPDRVAAIEVDGTSVTFGALRDEVGA